MSITITGPGALVEAVPHLLGFYPSDSVVLAFLSGKRAVCTARLDSIEATPALLDHTIQSVAKQVDGEFSYVAISFTENQPHLEQYEQLSVPPIDLVHVHDGRYRSVMCTSSECCPPEGIPVPNSVLSAELAYVGSAPTDGRASLEAEAEQAETLPAAIGAAREMQAILERDAEWRRIDAATDLTVLREKHSEWLGIARHSGQYAVSAYFLAAWAAFRLGDGARANVAVNHALDLDPSYSAAALLSSALRQGVNGSQRPFFQHA